MGLEPSQMPSRCRRPRPRTGQQVRAFGPSIGRRQVDLLAGRPGRQEADGDERADQSGGRRDQHRPVRSTHKRPASRIDEVCPQAGPGCGRRTVAAAPEKEAFAWAAVWAGTWARKG